MIEYKKVVGVFVFNNQGELALQLRALNDDSFPGYWDISAGGGVDDGESFDSSARRELKEELGVSTEIKLLHEDIFKYLSWKGVNREIEAKIYKAIHNGPFTPDHKEVEKVQFFKLDEIQKMIDSGEKFHPEFMLCWEKGIV